MKNIIYLTILLTIFVSSNLLSRGSGVSLSCDPDYPSEICYEYYLGDVLHKVMGRAGAPVSVSEVTTCVSGNIQISNIFIFDNAVGDGSGYSSGLGCISAPSTNVVFSPDNGIIVEHDYDSWLISVGLTN